MKFEIDLDIKDALFLVTILENSGSTHLFGDNPFEGRCVEISIREQIYAQICTGKNGDWRKKYKTNLNIFTKDLNWYAKGFNSSRNDHIKELNDCSK